MNDNASNNRAGGGALLIRALAAGFLTNSFLVLLIKMITFKFPVHFLTIGFMILSGMGFPLGLIASRKGMAWLKSQCWWICSLLIIFVYTSIVNQNVTTHFLLGNVYYPYPMPPKAYFYVGCLFVSLFASPLYFFLMGAIFGDVLARSRSGHAAHAMFFLGMAAGAAVGYFSVLWAGLYVPIAVCAALGAAMLPKRSWALIGTAACVALLILSIRNKNNIFYVWRIDEYRHLSEHWTPYYRIDFISFNKEHCLGGVYNTLMIWYTCDQVDMLPAEMRRILGEVTAGKERILLAGRTDGLYASMITKTDKALKEYVSVAEDPVAAKMMTGPYAKYNGYVFKRPEMKVYVDDIRHFMEKQANEGKKYDVVFLNGIGIALVMLPHGIMKQEDYLTTQDNYKVIFDKLLTKNGVFVIDWGSSNYDEFYPMMANVPPGVYVKAFHFWLGEFPLSGLPLFYVIASRDKAQLDRLSAALSTMPSIQEMKLEQPKVDAAKFTEDNPFHMKPLAPGLMGVMMPFFFMLLAVTAIVGFRPRWDVPVWRPVKLFYYLLAGVMLFLAFFAGQVFGTAEVQQKAGRFGLLGLLVLGIIFFFSYVLWILFQFLKSYFTGHGKAAVFFWFAGFCAGLLDACLYSRISRLMPGGPGPGAMMVGVAYCLGFAAPLMIFQKRGAVRAPLVMACAIPIICVLPWFASGRYEWDISLVLVFVLSALGCVPWAAGLGRVESALRPRALALWFFGSLAGLYIFQLLVFKIGFLNGGYHKASIVIGILYIVLALYFTIFIRMRSLAAAEKPAAKSTKWTSPKSAAQRQI